MLTEQEQKAQNIFEHIVQTYNSLLGKDPIEDLSQEQLVSLVNEEFNRCGFNYLIVRDFNRLGTCSIRFDIETRETLHSIDDVKKLLNREVDSYLKDFEETCQTYKRLIYNYLCAYQDEQNRKKQDNPFK